MAAFMVLWLQAQAYEEVGVDGLMNLLQKDTDTTYVVNFWATWCSPCIKEIPHFEHLHRSSADDPVQVYLVSLDFPRQADARLLPFLAKNQVTAPVFLMTNLDYNSWIERVDPSWSGAIPATLIYQGKQRIFLEKELSKEALERHVKQIAN